MEEEHSFIASFIQPKCDCYWPDAGSQSFGDLVVTLMREDILSSYTLRTFTVRKGKGDSKEKNNKEGAERTIYQYHFTAWPDHGVPLHALPLVTFVRNSSNASPADGGPIVVHCRWKRKQFSLINISTFAVKHSLVPYSLLYPPPARVVGSNKWQPEREVGRERDRSRDRYPPALLAPLLVSYHLRINESVLVVFAGIWNECGCFSFPSDSPSFFLLPTGISLSESPSSNSSRPLNRPLSSWALISAALLHNSSSSSSRWRLLLRPLDVAGGCKQPRARKHCAQESEAVESLIDSVRRRR